MTFPIRLKILREEKGYSQAMLAKEMGIAQSTIGGWEAANREPNIDMLIRISDYFGVTIDFLVGRSDVPHSTKTKTPPELESVGVESVVKTNNEPLTPDEVAAIRLMLEQNKS